MVEKSSLEDKIPGLFSLNLSSFGFIFVKDRYQPSFVPFYGDNFLMVLNLE